MDKPKIDAGRADLLWELVDKWEGQTRDKRNNGPLERFILGKMLGELKERLGERVLPK